MPSCIRAANEPRYKLGKRERESERDRTRYLFAAERWRIAPRLSVGVNQWLCACNLQYSRLRTHIYVYTHTYVEIFIAARVAATDAWKVLQIREGGLLLRPLSAPR